MFASINLIPSLLNFKRHDFLTDIQLILIINGFLLYIKKKDNMVLLLSASTLSARGLNNGKLFLLLYLKYLGSETL